MNRKNTSGASWDSMFLTAVKILTTSFSIIQTKLLASGLSLEQYGTYSQANIVVSIGTALTLLGLGDAINFFYNSKECKTNLSEKVRIVNTIFFLEIAAGVVYYLVVCAGRNGLASYFSNDEIKPLLILAAAKPALDNLLYFYQLLFVSGGKAKVIAVRNLVITLLKIMAMYIAVYILKDIIWIYVTLLALDIAQLVFFKLFFAKERFWVNPLRFKPDAVRKIITYSIPMGVFAITNILSREIDKLVIGRMTDTETLAIYTNCSKILPFDIVVVSFGTVLIPYIMRYVSSRRNQEAAQLFCNYMKVGYYSVWILGTAVLITSKQVISMLYSDAYIAGNSVFVIYILDSMLKFASMHLLLTAGGKSRLIMMYSIITLLLNLILNIGLYCAFGINGPAIATLLSTALYTFLILKNSVKLIDAAWKEVFDVKDMLSFAAILAATGVAFLVLDRRLLSLNINKYWAMLISAGGFCFVNLFINLKRIINTLKAVNSLRE